MFLDDEEDEDKHQLPRKEVIRRLRERGEPILLFGETELQAFKRLRKCEISEPELNKVRIHSEFSSCDNNSIAWCRIPMI